METEINRNQKKVVEQNQNNKLQSEQLKQESKSMDKKLVPSKDVETITLEPEQIEEIHADEYSLTLFYATRTQPMSLLEIKRQFAEPESKKAQSVMDRFLKAGLIHITREGKYYSNFPEGYINYANYRYDSDLEARKDSKVFQIMKEQTGKRDYWKDKTYFSIDAFFSDEQTKEMLELFKEIKLKAKQYANENSQNNNLKGLKFRRMKFYDMTLTIVFAVLLFFGGSSQSYAGGGGNDPTGMMRLAMAYDSDTMKCLAANDEYQGGGGHDPDAGPRGGGGYDPDGDIINSFPNLSTCWINIDGEFVIINDRKTCIINRLTQIIKKCDNLEEERCNYLLQELERLSEELKY